MASADPLIDPAITESELSSVAPSVSPDNAHEAAAVAVAAAAGALAASQYTNLGDHLIHDPTHNGSEGPESDAVSHLSHEESQHVHNVEHQDHQDQHDHLQSQHHAHHSPSIRAQPPPPAPTAYVQHYNPAAHSHLALYLAALHGSRITADNLSGTFAPPLHHEKLLDWWKVQLTTAAVFLLIRPPQAIVNGSASGYGSNYQSQPQVHSSVPYTPFMPQQTKISGQDLVGVIMLRSHPSETSPHVATIELLLVNLHYRQLGGERQLLETVEQQAVLEGRTVLTAETESDSSMAVMYKDLGFTEAGRIPNMINRPLTGEKRAQSIFYKELPSRQD